MKKIMTLSMVAIMIFTVAGCSSNKLAETIAAGTAVTETAAESDTTAADTAAEGETSGAVSGKKYVINTDITSAPFEFEGEKGEVVGIDLDILQVVVQDQGFRYEVALMGFSTAVIALETGECSGVIAGASIMGERVQRYDFSEPYYNSGVGMAVLADSGITPHDQLEDQKMTAKVSTKGCTFVESIVEQYGFEVTQCESSSDMCQAILAGKAITYFEDYPVTSYEISRGLDLVFPTPKEKGSSYGFATLKGVDPELVKVFNKDLENIKASGRYNKVLNTCIVK